MATKPAASTPERRAGGARAAAPGTAAAARQLQRADLPHGSARRQAPVRGRARGHDPGRAGWTRARAAVPRHLRPGHERRGERPAVDGVRARLRELAALLRLLHRPAGLPPDRPVPRGRGLAEPRRPELAPLGDPRARTPRSNHNGGHLPFSADGILYTALGDGGGGGDPEGDSQNQNTVRQDPPHRPARGRRRTRSRRPTRSRERGRSAGDLGVRLRNPWRFSFDPEAAIEDRRRRPGHVSKRSTGSTPASGAGGGRNFGWNHWEGLTEYAGGGPLAGPGHLHPTRPHLRAPRGRLPLDHRRLRRARSGRSRPTGRPLPVRRLLRGHDPARPPAPPERTNAPPQDSTWTASPRSARTAAAACTRSP